MRIETAEHPEYPGVGAYRGRAETLELLEQAKRSVLRCEHGTMYRVSVEIEFYHQLTTHPQWDDPSYNTVTGDD